MNKARSGYLLLSLAAAAGLVWWLKRSRSAAPDAAAAAGTDATAKALSNGGSFGQVGSNFAENITPEIVKLTLGYAADVQRHNGACWIRGDVISGDSRIWALRRPDGSTIQTAFFLNGTLPNQDLYPVCG